MCGIQDFGLNFHLPQKFSNFDHPVFLWTYVIEGYFSIFKVEKINQKLLKFITQRVFLGKSTTLNRVSISVFSSYFGRKILNFNYAIHQFIYMFKSLSILNKNSANNSYIRMNFEKMAYSRINHKTLFF